MRIISGNFKGKNLIRPDDIKTRPLKDLTKESIFNIINHSNKFKINLKESHVLDLFSGIGSFGIECLSRNSKKVYFVEKYKSAISILKKNLVGLNLQDKFEIIEKDVYDEDIFDNININFDIIFLDPPFKDNNIEKILTKIKNQRILNKNGIIIIHRHKKEKKIINQNLTLLEEKKYGISKIFFLSC